MNFFTTLLTTLVVASAIAYNVDTIDGTSGEEERQPNVTRNEVPPPAPPPSEIIVGGEE